MNIFKSSCDFSDIKQGDIIDESAFRPEKSEQLSASDILEKQVHILFVFEFSMQLNDIRMIYHSQNFSFCLNMIYLLEPDDLSLLKNFKSVWIFLFVLLFLSQDYSTKTACSHCCSETEVF